MDLAKGIKLVLERKGLTQKDLARKSNISEKSLSLLLNQHTSPTKETIATIARALDVTPELLNLLSFEKEDLPKENQDKFDMIWPQMEAVAMNLFLAEQKK